MLGVSAFFLLGMTVPAPPFERLSPVPGDGRGLNPLLEDSGMITHPVALYLGFTGFTVPFAFAMAAERPAEHVLGLAVVILPAVVEKSDPGVHALVDEPDRLVPRREISEGVTADSEGRHLESGAAEVSSRDPAEARFGALALGGQGSRRARAGAGPPQSCESHEL